MKKLLAIIAITFLVASCNTTKKTETKTSSGETTKVYTEQIKKARDSIRIQNLKSLETVILMYFQDTGEYPTKKDFYKLKEYLPKVPKDPLGDVEINGCKFGYFYEVGEDKNGIKNGAFRLSSCMETRKKIEFGTSIDKDKVAESFYITGDIFGKIETPKKEEEKKEEKVEDKKEEPVKKQEGPQVMLKKVIIIGDKNCKVCEEIKNTPEQIAQSLKTNAIFKNVDIKTYDVSDKQAQKIMQENELTGVPVILADTNEVIKGQKDPTLRKTKAGLYAAPGALYDYKSKKYLEEVGSLCTNKKDDDGDGKIDCKETSCLQTNPQACKAEIEKLQKEALKKRQEAMEKKLAGIKSDRPKVDLYVMSYCPFGTQAEKPFLNIMKKFKDVADVDVKFVQYVMHTSQGEGEENLLQYCIKTTQKEKFVPYLECFLQAGDSKGCLKKAKIDEAKVNSCIAETDKKFKIKEKLADKTQRFPEFPIDKETALKAGVQGSPTLVINGLKIDGVDRTEKGFAEIICKTFKTQPAICKDLSKFSTKSYKPGFGFDNTQSSGASAASCGTN